MEQNRIENEKEQSSSPKNTSLNTIDTSLNTIDTSLNALKKQFPHSQREEENYKALLEDGEYKESSANQAEENQLSKQHFYYDNIKELKQFVEILPEKEKISNKASTTKFFKLPTDDKYTEPFGGGKLFEVFGTSYIMKFILTESKITVVDSYTKEKTTKKSKTKKTSETKITDTSSSEQSDINKNINRCIRREIGNLTTNENEISTEPRENKEINSSSKSNNEIHSDVLNRNTNKLQLDSEVTAFWRKKYCVSLDQLTNPRAEKFPGDKKKQIDGIKKNCEDKQDAKENPKSENKGNKETWTGKDAKKNELNEKDKQKNFEENAKKYLDKKLSDILIQTIKTYRYSEFKLSGDFDALLINMDSNAVKSMLQTKRLIFPYKCEVLDNLQNEKLTIICEFTSKSIFLSDKYEQLKKYQCLIDILNKCKENNIPNIHHILGVPFDNQIILMVVSNGYYKDFLQNYLKLVESKNESFEDFQNQYNKKESKKKQSPQALNEKIWKFFSTQKNIVFCYIPKLYTEQLYNLYEYNLNNQNTKTLEELSNVKNELADVNKKLTISEANYADVNKKLTISEANYADVKKENAKIIETLKILSEQLSQFQNNIAQPRNNLN